MSYRALDEAERIASKDGSSLYRVSQYFDDPIRYDAFIAMYAVMRVIDDRVDEAGDKARLPEAERRGLHDFLDEWESRIRRAYEGRPTEHALELALAWAVARFPVPLHLWIAFLRAMRFDVEVPRFEDFETFLTYTEGASVSPTTIFVYLMTARCGVDEVYRVEGFDFERCGRHLGRFAYVAHILRDVKKDMEACESGLVYISRADLEGHGLDEAELRRMTRAGAGDNRFDRLVETLARRARVEQALGEALAKEVWSGLPVDCRFIFQLIVSTYGSLLDRIASEPGLVLRKEPILGSGDQARLAEQVAKEAGYPRARLRLAAGRGRRTVSTESAQRGSDVAWVLGGAALATGAICLLYPYPVWITLFMAVMLAVFLKRWATVPDRIGFAVGGVLGILTELISDWGGVWRHANTQVLGLMPAYLLFCYPLLGAAMPRLIRAWVGRDRGMQKPTVRKFKVQSSRLKAPSSSSSDDLVLETKSKVPVRIRRSDDSAVEESAASAGFRALALWGLLTALCFQFGDSNGRAFLACGLCLSLFLWQFRSAHDLATLLLGGLMGLLWELPCTWAGAWSFPNPQGFGLIPLWLPLAYAVFFGTVGRVTAVAVAHWSRMEGERSRAHRRSTTVPASFVTPRPEED